MSNPLTPATCNEEGWARDVPEALNPQDFARLWQREVPKVVARHQEERLRVRKGLGLVY